RIERVALVSPCLHLLHDILLIRHRVTHVDFPVVLVLDQAFTCAPGPDIAETVGEDDGFSREDHVGGRHRRCHDSGEIVWSEKPIDETDEWLAAVPGAPDRHMRTVEEQHEYAIPRIRNHLSRLSDA